MAMRFVFRFGADSVGPWTAGEAAPKIVAGVIRADTPTQIEGTTVWSTAFDFVSLRLAAGAAWTRATPPTTTPEPKTESPGRPLWDWAPLVNVDQAGRGLVLVRVEPGRPIVARVVGDPVFLLLHYADGSSFPCVGGRCAACDRGITRSLHAYFDGLAVSLRNGQAEFSRLCVAVPPAATKELEAMADEGESAIGRLVSLSRGRGRAPSKLEWLQLDCLYELPEPADVAQILCRRYRLDRFPQVKGAPHSVGSPAATSSPAVLPFRRLG